MVPFTKPPGKSYSLCVPYICAQKRQQATLKSGTSWGSEYIYIKLNGVKLLRGSVNEMNIANNTLVCHIAKIMIKLQHSKYTKQLQ